MIPNKPNGSNHPSIHDPSIHDSSKKIHTFSLLDLQTGTLT
jgi:hypothetical protein